jgi:hypothetical protein
MMTAVDEEIAAVVDLPWLSGEAMVSSKSMIRGDTYLLCRRRLMHGGQYQAARHRRTCNKRKVAEGLKITARLRSCQLAKTI